MAERDDDDGARWYQSARFHFPDTGVLPSLVPYPAPPETEWSGVRLVLDRTDESGVAHYVPAPAESP